MEHVYKAIKLFTQDAAFSGVEQATSAVTAKQQH